MTTVAELPPQLNLNQSAEPENSTPTDPNQLAKQWGDVSQPSILQEFGMGHLDPIIQNNKERFKEVAEQAGKEFDDARPALEAAHHNSFEGYLGTLNWDSLRTTYIESKLMEEYNSIKSGTSAINRHGDLHGAGAKTLAVEEVFAHLNNDGAKLNAIVKAEPQGTKEIGIPKNNVRIVDEANDTHRDVTVYEFLNNKEFETFGSKKDRVQSYQDGARWFHLPPEVEE